MILLPQHIAKISLIEGVIPQQPFFVSENYVHQSIRQTDGRTGGRTNLRSPIPRCTQCSAVEATIKHYISRLLWRRERGGAKYFPAVFGLATCHVHGCEVISGNGRSSLASLIHCLCLSLIRSLPNHSATVQYGARSSSDRISEDRFVNSRKMRLNSSTPGRY